MLFQHWDIGTQYRLLKLEGRDGVFTVGHNQHGNERTRIVEIDFGRKETEGAVMHCTPEA